LRLLLGQMLRKAGHAAVPAADGREAVELYVAGLAGAQRFDAVLLDLTVRGGMGGREAAEEILRRDPAARLIVSSGYAEDPIVARFAEYGFAAALGKPYGPAELLEALARATAVGS